MSEMLAALERVCASDTVHGSDLVPGAAVTVVENENTLSPDVASPFVPLSKSVCDAEPPIAVRSQATARLVLGGFVPGVTVTVSRLDAPLESDAGEAEPTPVGELQKCGADAEFRGDGAPAVKSAALLSVSVQPAFPRRSDAVAEIVGAGPEPSKKFAPDEPVP